MEKIHNSLRPGGQFIGTLFFLDKNSDPRHTELMQKIGAHFYPESDFGKKLLEHSKFKVIDYETLQYSKDQPATCVQFLAEKV